MLIATLSSFGNTMPSHIYKCFKMIKTPAIDEKMARAPKALGDTVYLE